MIDNKYLSHIKKIFKKEMLYCDYFHTKYGHVTGIHNEMNSSINVQIEGTKKWLLIDPKYLGTATFSAVLNAVELCVGNCVSDPSSRFYVRQGNDESWVLVVIFPDHIARHAKEEPYAQR